MSVTRGSLTIDVSAQITGYQNSLNEMKKAIQNIDAGSDIGKQLKRGIEAAQKEINSFGSKATKKLFSHDDLDNFTDRMVKLGQLMGDLGKGFQQVGWRDLTTGAIQEIQQLEAQIEHVNQSAQTLVSGTFTRLQKDFPELGTIFQELKIDPRKMGLDQIQSTFTSTLTTVDEQISNVQASLANMRKEAERAKTALASIPRVDDSILAVTGKASDIKTYTGQSGLKRTFNMENPQLTNYRTQIDEFGQLIKDNLNSGHRQNNQALIQQITTQLDNQLDRLKEARTQEAINSIVDEIDRTLQQGSGQRYGTGLRGTTHITGKMSAVNQWTNRLTEHLPVNTDPYRVNPDVLENTRARYQSLYDQLLAVDRDAGENLGLNIQRILDNLVPTQDPKVIEAQLNGVADALKKGYDNIRNARTQAERNLENINAGITPLEQQEKALIEKRGSIAAAQQKVDPTVVNLRAQLEAQRNEIQQLRDQIAQITAQADAAGNKPYANLGDEAFKNSKQQIEAAKQAAEGYSVKLDEIQQKQQALNSIMSFAQRWFSVYAAMRLVSNAFKSIKSNLKELDDVMTEIAIVTNMSQGDLWKQMPSYINMAREYAVSIKGVYEVSQLYYQQGLQQNEVMALTEETLKMARISGLSYADATNYMTNAVRSFKMEMSESQRVVDVYSALAASSATNTKELATAMSKTASSAQAVGASFENTTAMMAVMIEATREAPENIGTAMKSIISRYGEMKEDPSKLVDSEGEELSLNKVDKALQAVGISLHDAQGEFRNFDDVIMELAASWDTIDKNTQRYIATVMAGNRQQSRFLALVSNYDRLIELSEKAADSEDAATLQVLKTMDSVSAKSQQLQTSLQSMYVNTGLEQFYKNVLDFTNQVIGTFTNMPTLFKLPIPAILSFGQIFINVGTSLVTVAGMLRKKLLAESQTTQDNMVAAEEVAGNKRKASETDVWNQHINVAKKSEQEISGSYNRIAEAAENAGRRRIAAMNGASNYVPNSAAPTSTTSVDWSKFNRDASETLRPEAIEQAYKQALKGNVEAVAYFANRKDILKSQNLLTEKGGFVDIYANMGNAAEQAGEKVANFWTKLKGNQGAIIGLRMAGSTISMLAAGMNEATKGARGLKGSIQLVGGALQTVSYILAGNPIMAAFTIATTAVQTLSTWIETAKERANRLHDAAEKASQAFLQKKSDAKTLDEQIKKLEELEKAQHDSAEARQEYLEMSNRIAEQHPELVSGYDSEGNAIIDVARSYEELAQARREAADAAKDAAEASAAEVWNSYNEANKNRDDARITRLNTNFYGKNNEKFDENLAKANDFQTSEAALYNPSIKEFLDNLLNANMVEAVQIAEQQDFQNALNDLADSADETEKDLYEWINSLFNGIEAVDKDIASFKETALSTMSGMLLKQIDSTIQSIQANDKIENKTDNKFLSEFSAATEMIDTYMVKQLRGFENSSYFDSTKEEDLLTQFNADEEHGYQYYYEQASEAVKKLWENAATSTKKEDLTKKLSRKGMLSQQAFIEQFEDIDKVTTEILQDYYGDTFDNIDLSSAIINRRKNGSKLYVDLSDMFGMGETQLKSVLSVFDTIDKQVENKNISAQLGQQIVNSYTEIYNKTKEFGDNALVAQQMIASWDDYSLSGLNQFREIVKNSILNPQQQKILIESAEKFAKALPVNFETEFQSFSRKVSSDMEDFEKALSKASKGMDLKDAIEIAQKLDTTIDTFDFRDGKYFITNVEDIKDAYFKGIKEYLDDLNEAYKEKKGEYIRSINTAERTHEYEDAATLEKELADLEENHAQVESEIGQYLEYQINTYYIQNGLLREFLTNLLGKENSAQIEKQLNLIQTGKYSDLDEKILPYTNALYELVNKIQSDIFNKAIDSINGEGPQMIDATYATEAQKKLLKTLGREVSPGQYLIDLTLEDVEDVRKEIEEAITEGIITKKQGRSYLADLHKAEYEDNIYSALEGVVGNFNKMSYEAVQSLAAAIGETVTFDVNADGSLASSYDEMLTYLQKNMESMTAKEYNDLRAKLEAANNKLKNETIFADIIKNRDTLNEEQVANLATMLGANYDAIADLIKDNGNGTKSLDLATIRAIIDKGLVQVTDEIEQLIATEIDEIIASLNGLGDIQNKGTTKIADMQKQVAEINKLSGQSYTMQDLFVYSDVLHGFVYNYQGLIESAKQTVAQIGYLSDEERWAAEQMLENTRNTFLQNIDVSAFLNAEQITPQIEQNLRDSISAFNLFCVGIGNESRILREGLITALKEGGTQGVAAAQEIARMQGKELSASDVEAAYRRQVKSLIDAIDTVASNAGALVDKTTADLINMSGGKATELAGTGQYVVETAANLYQAYHNLYQQLWDSGEATLEDLNKIAGLALENKDGEQAAIDALGDAAGMTYTRFGEILAQQGYQLTEDLINQMVNNGIIKQLGGGKMQIADFSEFAKLMNWNANSEEYVSAFKTYNDSLIEMNRQAEKNILEEAKNIGNAKVGDWLNITQLQNATLAPENYNGNVRLQNRPIVDLGEVYETILGVSFTDVIGQPNLGITLASIYEDGTQILDADLEDYATHLMDEAKNLQDQGDTRSLSEIVKELDAAEKNLLLDAIESNGMAEKEFISLLNSRAEELHTRQENWYDLLASLEEAGAIVEDGILKLGPNANIPAIMQSVSNVAEKSGNLLSSEMAELADTLADVLKGYAELIQNGIKGTLTHVQADQLKTIGQQLGVEIDFTPTKEGLKASQQSAMQLYNELKKIDAIQGQLTLETLADSLQESNENYKNISTVTRRIAELQKLIQDAKPGDARLQMYKEELAVAQDIQRVRSSTDNKDFNFMDRSLANGMQNPIDYWNATGEAYKAMNQASKTGYMEIQDFYNIVNEMNDMALSSGQTLTFMGQKLSGSAEDAARLIEAGMGALKNIDGEGVKVSLKNLGAGFKVGAVDMTGDFDDGVKAMAKSQIKMLDAAIRMLEAMVAMEDIDVNGDGTFGPEEVFKNGFNANDGFTSKVEDWAKQLEVAAGGISIGGKSLLDALAGLEPEKAIKVLEQLRNIDWTLGDQDVFGQIQNILAVFFPGVSIQQRGPSIFEALDMPSDANSKLKSFQDWCKKAGVAADIGKRLYQHLAEGNNISIKSSLFDNLEQLLGLTKKGQKDTFEKFIGKDGIASQEEIELWSQLNLDWKRDGTLKSATYIDTEGNTHDLIKECSKDGTGWSDYIAQIEEDIDNRRTITNAGGGNTEGATTGEPIEIHSGVPIKTVLDAKGQVYFTYNGKSYGPYPDKKEAEEALRNLELQDRSIGGTVTIGEDGNLVTKSRFVRKSEAELSPEDKKNKDDADKLIQAIHDGNADPEAVQAKINDWYNSKDNTLTIPGFEKIQLGEDEDPAAVLQELVDTIYGPDEFAEIPNKIAEGIQQAFQGEAGDKIGEAIKTGIQNAFGTNTETGEQAISVDNIIITPTTITIDPTNSSISGLDKVQELLNTGNANEEGGTSLTADITVTLNNGEAISLSVTGVNTDSDTWTINGIDTSGNEVHLDGTTIAGLVFNGANWTVGEVLGNKTSIALGSATITGLEQVGVNSWQLTAVTAGGQEIKFMTPTIGGLTAVGENWQLNSFLTNTTGVDLGAAKVTGLSYADGAWIMNTTSGSLTLTLDSIAGLNSPEGEAGYSLDSNISGTIDLSATTNTAESIWLAWLDAQSKTSTIDITPKIKEPQYETPREGEGGKVDPGTAGIRGFVHADKATIDNATIDKQIDASNSTVELGSPTITTTNTVTVSGATVNVTGGPTPSDNGGRDDKENRGPKKKSNDADNNTPVEKKTEINLDTAQATNSLTKVQGALDGISATQITTTKDTINGAIDSVSSKFSGAASNINSIAKDIKSIPSIDKQVTLKYTTQKSAAKGTFGGSAFATGTRTLMGELGPEMVVSNGRYYVVGENGAEFVNLAKDSIVFNHKQTKKLLNNGAIGSRGKPTTSINNAISFAKGGRSGPAKFKTSGADTAAPPKEEIKEEIISSVTVTPTSHTFKLSDSKAKGSADGPALASAKAALSQLKAIRAMWQRMLDASAKDLGSQAGRGGKGGGGGGGGGGKDDKDQPKTTTAEIQRWYNWLRQIEHIEMHITEQEKYQSLYESDRVANGELIYKTQKDRLKLLDQEIVRNQKLAELQKKWYDNKRKELAESSYGKIFTYDEYGLQQYVGEDRPGSGVGLDILENLTRRDVNGKPIGHAATAEAQLKYLKSVGFNINELLYNDDGTRLGTSINFNAKKNKKVGGKEKGAKDNDIFVQMMENFWDRVDGWRDELDGLYDSYHEQLEKVIENQTKQNELIQAMVDNELSIEQDLVKAIEDREQAEIDRLQDERDALDEASSKFLDGLNDSLSKEREMYEKNQAGNELTKLQRQLAILQRSGGSASQIKSLQDQIASKQKDAYFDAQQSQIDAIQEASDKQIEKLDTQIDLMTKNLEYQKENGLLWAEVRQIMNDTNTTSSDVAAMILAWSKQYRENSALQNGEDLTDFTERYQEWEGFREDKKTLGTSWSALEEIINADDIIGHYTGYLGDTDTEAHQKATAVAKEASITAYDEEYQKAIKEGATENEAKERAQKAGLKAYQESIKADAENTNAYKSGDAFSNWVANEEMQKQLHGSSYYSSLKEEDQEKFREEFLKFYSQGNSGETALEKAQNSVRDSAEERFNELTSIVPTKDIRTYEYIPATKKKKAAMNKKEVIAKDMPRKVTGILYFNKKKYLQLSNGRYVLASDVPNGGAIYDSFNYLDNLKDNKYGNATEATISNKKLAAYNDALQNIPIEEFTLDLPKNFALSDNISTRTVDESGNVTTNSLTKKKKMSLPQSFKIAKVNGLTMNKDQKVNFSSITVDELKGGTKLSKSINITKKQLEKGKLYSKLIEKIKDYINKKIGSNIYEATFKTGGIADFTGPAWLDGTPSAPEAVLNAAQTKFLREDMLGNSSTSLISIVAALQDAIANTSSGSSSYTEGITIENVSINFQPGVISNDYSAKRAGDMAIQEIIKVARKAGNNSVSRR